MHHPQQTSTARTIGRYILAVILIFPGIAHLTFARNEFLAQVPQWVPLPRDFVVVASGIVEILLGLALIIFPSKKIQLGWIIAIYFILIFPGNISQYITGTDAFGLDTDFKRGLRLFFQPLLVVLAVWSTGAWRRSKTKGAII